MRHEAFVAVLKPKTSCARRSANIHDRSLEELDGIVAVRLLERREAHAFREKPIDVICATPASSTCGAGGEAAGAGAGAARKASRVRGFFGGGRHAGALRPRLAPERELPFDVGAHRRRQLRERCWVDVGAVDATLDASGRRCAGCGTAAAGGSRQAGAPRRPRRARGFHFTSFRVVWPFAKGVLALEVDDRTPISRISSGVPAASASPMASRSRGFRSLMMAFTDLTYVFARFLFRFIVAEMRKSVVFGLSVHLAAAYHALPDALIRIRRFVRASPSEPRRRGRPKRPLVP